MLTYKIQGIKQNMINQYLYLRQKDITEKLTEDVRSSAFKVLARPKSPASKLEIFKLQQ